MYPVISSSKISQVVLTSTPNGFNLFYDLYTESVKGENDYTNYRVDWWQVPGRDDAWRDQEIGNLGSEEAFNIQYGNSFITADGRLHSPDHIERLEKAKTKYVFKPFEELLDLYLDYEKYWTVKPDFNLERVYDENNFFLFSIDIAEGGGGASDSSVINIFELDVMDLVLLDKLNSVSSYQDFFALKQVAIFSSNEVGIEEFAKIAYTLIFRIFDSENLKVVLEMNTYGGEFLKNMQLVFPGQNDFEDEVIIKFRHREDQSFLKMGLRIKPDNKPILAQNYKKFYHLGRIELSEPKTVDEAISFGKDKRGRYRGLMGHDDSIITAINGCEFFSTVDYADMVELKFETLSNEVKNILNTKLDILESEESDGVHFDIYSVL